MLSLHLLVMPDMCEDQLLNLFEVHRALSHLGYLLDAFPHDLGVGILGNLLGVVKGIEDHLHAERLFALLRDPLCRLVGRGGGVIITVQDVNDDSFGIIVNATWIARLSHLDHIAF